ncbi:endospore germination permease [Anoxybacillus sp. LAT_38]|uniref:GerAB/ArcD/ProY family transporter n=1 Tax=Anoxybacillus sp. LAT_26 TaxID=2862719 RepID=UPI001EEBE6F9|nr:endospore germination permease [Anoxybacillus sp. LAT_26]MCG6182308.1 endospore germination permease [Anoxybacillus sp. LAT_26]MCG6196149.1 endospore germination permease [Anoxybacillus sp. LAT_38]
MSDQTISPKQVIIVFMLSVGLVNHVMVIPVLLEVAGRDAWMSILVTAILYTMWLFFLYRIIKKMNGQTFFEWVSRRMGRFIAWAFCIIIALFLFLMMSVTIKDTLTWTITSYFPQTPIFILSLLFILTAYICVSSNIQSLAIAAGVILFFVVILGFFVMTTNFIYKDYTRLFPVFEKGIFPMLRGVTYSAGGLAELALLIFLQQRIKPTIQFKNMWVLGMILVGLTLGPLMGSITIFNVSESVNQRYPAYEQWRMLQIGKYISHVDFFSIYQWLSGALIRVCFILFVMIDLFPLQRTNQKWLLRVICAFLLMVSLIPIGDASFYEFVRYIYFPMSLCFFITLSIFVGLLTIIKKG